MKATDFISLHKKHFSFKEFVHEALQEDAGDGDHTSLATINKNQLKHYVNTEEITIKTPANVARQGPEAQKLAEGKEILKNLTPGERLVLLDENGKEYSSREFAAYVEKAGVGAVKSMVFVIGGPFGFSEEVYEKADARLSLSRMTFSHQMVRLFFWEQLYRAFTIIKGEKYHHD